MKRKNQTLRTMGKAVLMSCSMLLAAATASNAQTYVPPVSYEDTYPAAGSPDINLTTHTSCYSISGFNFYGNSEDLLLSAWDDPSTNSGVAWRRTMPGNPSIIFAQGTIPYSNVRDLEVGLLASGAGWEIYVAYYLNGTGHFLDVYDWNPGGPTLLYTVMLSTSPNYGRISMDSHKLYGLTMVWENPSVGAIETMVGLSGGTTTYSGVITIGGMNGHLVPDCAFTHAGPLNVHYVSWDPASSQFIEYSLDYFATLPLPTGTTVGPTVNDKNPEKYALPNLDAPDHYGVENWAYTYTTNAADISVRLVDFNSGTPPTTVIVNNGSLGNKPTNVGCSYNNYPFLAYTNGWACGGPNANINVGWYTNNIDPNTSMPAGYVGLEMKENGTGLVSPMDYWTLANVPWMASNTPVMSFSKQNDMSAYQYTIFPESGYQMQHKFHNWCPTGTGFKGVATHDIDCNSEKQIAAFRAKQGYTLTTYPNPFSKEFSLKIPAGVAKENGEVIVTDMTGKIVASYKGIMSNANNYLHSISSNMATGNYLMKVSVESLQINQTLKMSKTK